MPEKILLINPWIYDFAAYDMWSRPLGLLYIGGLLLRNGYEINLINCLDRYNPRLLKFQNRESPKNSKYGCGKFHKEVIQSPGVLKDIKRRYGRYGLPMNIFRRELENQPQPDVIMVTSGMTYWYPGVFAVIEEIHKYYPGIPVVLGGIYATLCYEHAVKYSGADYIIPGEGEVKALKLISELTKKQICYLPENLDDYPYPAHHLMTNQNEIAILTSRGCPIGCTYCASKLLAGKFRQRDPAKIIEELDFYRKNFVTRDFVFYDDALLINPDKHIIPILREIIKLNFKCNFHTPNAIHAKQINEEIAELMFKSGFKTIRIGFETSDEFRQKKTGNKVTSDEFYRAVKNLKKAGYPETDIGVYVLMGLPEQPVEEVFESVRYVHNCGALVKLAMYSPIPGTTEWKRALEISDFDLDSDPLLHNNSIYPLRSKSMNIQDFQRIKKFVIECNLRLKSRTKMRNKG
ncbi:radical SAM protein [Candidatus Poribacteria bacterium]|nr:radical SAM protein [Candidatus Poribacteria bacterium]